jgi:histidinol-phosphate aminotransferase
VIEVLGPDPRPGLRDVAPYASVHSDVDVRLNANECPHSLPDGFFRQLGEAVHDLPLNRYPDEGMTRLREELAHQVGHGFAGTWTANGSNEVLTELLLAYGGPGRRAVMFEPTYLLHSRLAWLTQTDVIPLELREPWRIGPDEVEAAAARDPHVIFICSPNNPTGNAQPVEMVAALARQRPESLVIVDEAYIEFGGESALPLVAGHPNVAVVRTFSKAFALAGARIGYVLADPAVVGDLQRVRLPYHMGQLTQTAGIVALGHRTEAMSILSSIRTQRDRIVQRLSLMPGVRVHPSDANFVLFVPPGDATAVWQGLLDRGVLIRDMTSVVPNSLRVTAGSEHEVDLFFAALTEVLGA